MRIDNPSISGSLSFIGGTNSISATSVSLTGSLSGTFEGAFSGDSLTNISGAFNSVSESLAQDITANASSINSLNAASSSYLLNTTDTLDGNLTVTGKITAQEFHTEFVSASIIYESGSTQFGNSADDTHIFTGNVGIGTSALDYPLHVSSSAEYVIGITSNYSITNFQNIVSVLNPTMTANKNLSVNIGKAGSTNNLGKIAYKHSSDGSTDNLLGLGFFDNDFILNVVATGRVGIGTTSPTAGLTIRGTSGGSAIDLTNSTATTGRTYRWVSLNAGGFAVEDITDGGTKRLVIDSSGNVGINNDTPTQKLDVRGNIKIDGANTGNVANFIMTRTDASWRIANETDFRIYSGGGNTDSPGNLRMQINSAGNSNFTGNLGIGSSTPTQKLDVVGTIKGQTARFTSNFGHSFGDTANAGTRGLSILNSTLSNETYYLTLGKAESINNQAEISFSHVSDGSASNSLRLGLYGDPDHVVILGSGNVYFPNGNVGVGTTSTAYVFQVKDNGTTNYNSWFGTGTVRMGGSADHGSNQVVSLAPGRFGMDNPGVVNGRFVIEENGRVGIGTATPDDKIHVKVASGDAGLQLNAATQTLRLDQNSIRTTTNSSLAIFTNNTVTNGVYIEAGGDVGIGTNNPAAKLDVYGDIYVNGTQSYPVVAIDRRHVTNGSTTISSSGTFTDIGSSISYTPKQTGNIIMVYHGCQTWYGSSTNGSGDLYIRFLVNGTEVWENSRATGNFDADSTRQHLYLSSIFTFTASNTSAHTIKFQAYASGTVVDGFNLYHTNSDANQFIFVEYQV